MNTFIVNMFMCFLGRFSFTQIKTIGLITQEYINQSIVKNENLHDQRVMSLVQASNIYQETHTHTHTHTHTGLVLPEKEFFMLRGGVVTFL